MMSRMSNNDADQLSRIRRLCHQLCASSCVNQKRHGLHVVILKQRPHWSVLKKEEQFRQIDLGEKVPFDIALPLPARDPDKPDSEEGVKLFWETFKCERCGRCCYTPGAGLYLEKEDFEKIAEHLGSKKKLRSLCRYDKDLKAWVLRQPCPFYDTENKECRIYEIRPLTCTKYPLHPPLREMPYNLAVDAFCPGARDLAKETLGWWIICENNWAKILSKLTHD
ncbi:Putative zinc- or iron-chelating domain protein [uncultured archaeon]|nr:Putative zinc- or iron-chelating domain protein [uncultured archaeon]